MKNWLASKNKHFQVQIYVCLATLLGFVLRFAYITKSSIWHDEGFSVLLSSRAPNLIWAGSARDVHPPLYYELLHVWMLLFGNTELAIRSLSAIAGLALVPLGYLLVKKIANTRAAIIASFVLACAPFLIRYSQEARMYGLLSLLLVVALLCVAYIADKPKMLWPYVLYTLAITAGMYTHYFTALAIASFWIYFLVLQSPRRIKLGKSIVLSTRWWLANIIALILFLPWLGNMLAQLRRGQGLSWLPKTTWQTYHDTIWQFLTFTDAHKLLYSIYLLVPIIVIIAAVYLLLSDKTSQKYSRLIVSFSFVPIITALIISTQKPIFHERYFVFAAVGIYIIVAMTIDRIAGKRLWLLALLVVFVVGIELIGVRNVYSQSSHKMRDVMAVFNKEYNNGDKILAGELYVYFDGSYYNKSGQAIQLYTANSNLNGYGESGLLYDQNVYVNNFNQIPRGRIWIIGKTGDHNYYNQIPTSWQLLMQYQAGYSEIRLYQVK